MRAEALILLTLTGCGYRQLSADVRGMQLELDALQSEVAALGTDGVDPALDEGATVGLIQAYEAQLSAFELEAAGETLRALDGIYPGSRAWEYVSKLREEHAVIGQPAPPIEVERWFTAPGDEPAALTVLIFWETWCPYCREEVPKMQARVASIPGLQVIGLTRVTGSATEEGVQSFIDEHGLSFPIGRESGALTEAFKVHGIPAAAVIEGGQVTWRGHPGKLNWDQIAQRAQRL